MSEVLHLAQYVTHWGAQGRPTGYHAADRQLAIA